MTDNTTTVLCWCETDEVTVPVEWIKQGKTSACGRPACAPGCEPADHHEDEPEPLPGKFKMSRFRPETYDPGADSTPGLSRGDHPALVLAHAIGLCWCGCAEPVVRPKARFLMGHDMRLLGKLIRGQTVEIPVTLVDPDTGIRTDVEVLVYADSLSTGKKDWAQSVRDGADKIRRRGTEVAQTTEVVQAGAKVKAGRLAA